MLFGERRYRRCEPDRRVVAEMWFSLCLSFFSFFFFSTPSSVFLVQRSVIDWELNCAAEKTACTLLHKTFRVQTEPWDVALVFMGSICDVNPSVKVLFFVTSLEATERTFCLSLSAGEKKMSCWNVKAVGARPHFSQYQPVNTLVWLKGHLPYKSPHAYSSLLLFETLLSESLSVSFIPSFLPLNWRKPASSSYPPSSGPFSSQADLAPSWSKKNKKTKNARLASWKSKKRAKAELKVSCWARWRWSSDPLRALSLLSTLLQQQNSYHLISK